MLSIFKNNASFVPRILCLLPWTFLIRLKMPLKYYGVANLSLGAFVSKWSLATNVARANRVLSLADSPTTPLVSRGCVCHCRLSTGKFYLIVIHSKSLFVICFYFNFCLVYRVSLFFRNSTYFSDSFLFSMKTSLPCRISPAS